LGVDGRPESLLAVSRDVTDRKRSEDLFRRLSQATAAATGTRFFTLLVETLAAVLRVRLALVTECKPGNKAVRTLAFWKDDGLSENIEYPLAGTPCEAVVGGETRFYPDRLCQRFPEDTDLADLGIESFLGLPMVGGDGE